MIIQFNIINVSKKREESGGIGVSTLAKVKRTQGLNLKSQSKDLRSPALQGD